METAIWRNSPYTLKEVIERSKSKKLIAYKIGEVVFARAADGRWYEFMVWDGRTVYKSAARTFQGSDKHDVPTFHCEVGNHICDLKFMVIVSVDHHHYAVCDECVNEDTLQSLRAKGYRVAVISGAERL